MPLRLAFLLTALLSLNSFCWAQDAFTRGPVLSLPEPGVATVRARSAKPMECLLEVSIASKVPKRLLVKPEQKGPSTTHGFRFSVPKGLTFRYRILDKEARELAKGHGRSPAKAGSSFRFAVLGDSGTASKEQFQVARLIEDQKPHFVLHTGDIVYPQGEAARQDPVFFKPYKKLLKSTPFFVSLGNHDIYTKKGAPTLAAHDLPHNNPANTERYYSFDWGDAHIVALDSNDVMRRARFLRSDQGKWLEADLLATTKTWRIVFFHHPPYSCMATRAFNEVIMRHRLGRQLERWGVDIVFNGHDHFYHRSKPIKEGKVAKEGTVYIVTAGGGRKLYDGGPRSKTDAFARRYHACIIDMSPKKLRLRALSPRTGKEPEVLDDVTLTAKR